MLVLPQVALPILIKLLPSSMRLPIQEVADVLHSIVLVAQGSVPIKLGLGYSSLVDGPISKHVDATAMSIPFLEPPIIEGPVLKMCYSCTMGHSILEPSLVC